jgi:hypothetical protein
MFDVAHCEQAPRADFINAALYTASIVSHGLLHGNDCSECVHSYVLHTADSIAGQDLAVLPARLSSSLVYAVTCTCGLVRCTRQRGCCPDVAYMTTMDWCSSQPPL